jgi:urease accessory protein
MTGRAGHAVEAQHDRLVEADVGKWTRASSRRRGASFSSPEWRVKELSDSDLQRADGCGRLVVSGSEEGVRIVDVFQRSPVRIMFPRVGSAIEEAVLVNTAGGIAGGDRLKFRVKALANASIAVTTQTVEKVYRALNEPARIATKLQVCEAAKLAWLPQETIVFNRGRLSRATEVELSPGAELNSGGDSCELRAGPIA